MYINEVAKLDLIKEAPSLSNEQKQQLKVVLSTFEFLEKQINQL